MNYPTIFNIRLSRLYSAHLEAGTVQALYKLGIWDLDFDEEVCTCAEESLSYFIIDTILKE